MKIIVKNNAFEINNICAVINSICVQKNTQIDFTNEIKTCVKEMLQNCLYHSQSETIDVDIDVNEDGINIKVKDFGIGIEDIEKALQPMYSTCDKEERAGLGFTIMEVFADSLSVKNNEDKGLTVEMFKKWE